MSLVLKQALSTHMSAKVFNRTICSTGVLCIKKWRVNQGLPENKTSAGPLTDSADYTFLDGRPTPLLHKQKMRFMKQRKFAERIIELNEELDFAVQREKLILKAKDEERQKYINNKLKPKGDEYFKKSV